MNLHNLFTVKVISGRVQLEMKFARATSLRYSVQLCGSGVSGQSCFEKTMLAAHGGGRVAVEHASTFQQCIDGIALRDSHGTSSDVVLDIHAKEAGEVANCRNVEAFAKLSQERSPRAHARA